MALKETFALAAGAALLAVPGMAQAAQSPCLTVPEFTSLATYALPSVIDGASRRCAASLPAGSFLASQGPALVARYAAGKPGAWPGAKAAFLKLAGADKPEIVQMFGAMPDPQLQQVADMAIGAKMTETIPVARCGSIDRLLALLAPLPSQSTAEIIVLAAGLGASTGQARIGKIAICPA